MTEAQVPEVAGKSAGGQIIDIGTVAAHNIAQAIGVGEEHVEAIRQAIRDEISAMSSHFTLAVADVETHYEVEVNKLQTKFAADVAAIKADFVWLKANKLKVTAVAAVVVFVGALIGHFV